MSLDDRSVIELGERVKSVHGEEVYQQAMQRAIGIATKKAVPVELPEGEPLFPDHSDVPAPSKVIVADALTVALRAEFLRLLRPH